MRVLAPIVPLVLWLAPAASACDLASAPPAIAGPATDWLAAAPEPLADSLRRRGVAFAERAAPAAALAPLCADMLPAVVIFDGPPAAVFALLTQTERQGEFMSGLRRSIPISRAPGDHIDRHDIRILFTHLTYHVRHFWDEGALRIWWDLAPGLPNDLRRMTGYWELYPLDDDRSLGFYGTSVDVGALVPARMQRTLTERSMRTAVTHIREWVDRQRRAAR